MTHLHYSYLYDFLSIAFERKAVKEGVAKIILFGSLARGKVDEKSDIDVFIEPRSKALARKLEIEFGEALKSFEIEAEKVWHPRKISLPIKFIVGFVDDPVWASLRSDLISNGILLFGKFEAPPKKVKHSALFYFSLRGLKAKDKMGLLRRLFGYSTKKRKKVYVHEGLLPRIGGLKLAPNTILVPLEESLKVRELLSEFKVHAKVNEVWIQE